MKKTQIPFEMNGEPPLLLSGAPLRLRNKLERGFKQVKGIQGIEPVASFKDRGPGTGEFNEENEHVSYRASL